MNEHKLIVVLGMHRSGTSVITRGLQALGVDLGDIDGLTRSGEDNPKGFWEDADINQLNTEMLSFLQKDWDSLIPVLAEDIALLRENNYHTRALDLLRKKTADKDVFGFKDPRVAKLLRFWKDVFIEGQWNVSYVITVRNPLSVHKSLAQRNGFDPGKSYLLWLEHVINSLSGTTGEKRILIDYDCLMQSSRRELEKIAKALHLQIDSQLLKKFETEFLDKTLRHTTYSLEHLLDDESVPPLVQEVYSSTLDAALNRVELENPAFQVKIEQYQKEFLGLKSFLTFANRLILSNSDLTLKLNEKERHLNELTTKLAQANARIKHMNEVNEDLQTQINNLMVQISNLKMQMSNLKMQMSNLKIHLDNTWNSASWKITRPLRFSRRFFENPKLASYELASFLLESSPKSLQRFLENPARKAIRGLRRIQSAFSDTPSDLIKEIAKRFDVPENFVIMYRSQGHGPIDWNKSDWQEFYEHLPPLQKLSVPFAMSTVIRGRDMLSLLASHSRIQNKKRYLDVGTGYGGFLRAAKEVGFEEVVGIEFQPHLVELATTVVDGLPGAKVAVRDFIKDDISGLGSFDLITCNDVIEHVDDPGLAIEKMVSLLNPDSTLSFEVPNKDCLTFVQSDGHFQIFGITQLTRNAAAEYHSAYTGADKSVYLFEMGEMYELEWYFERLLEKGLSAHLADTHRIGDIKDIPQLLANLRQAYQKWKTETKPKLGAEIAQQVMSSVEKYMNDVESDYSILDNEESKQKFVNKYLRSFWTIISTKNRHSLDIPEA